MVVGKIFFLNELAPEGVYIPLGALLVFDLYIQYSGWRVTKMPRGCCCGIMGYVVWGLDMRFLGRKWQKKIRVCVTPIRSLV
jgi:hypothetical protein